MIENLSQHADTGFWIMQAAVGLVFLVHGLAKLQAPGVLGKSLRIPSGVAVIFGLIETIGGLMMITNYYTTFAAIAFIVIMLGAIYHKQFKWKVGFMEQQATGWEFDFVLLAASVAILLS